MTATDAAIHRCDACGTWCVGSKPCTTCNPTPIPKGTTA